MTRLTYIASPYSHPTPEMRQQRANEATGFVAWAMKQGVMYPISPIAHSHEASVRCDLPTDAAWWQAYNHALFAACGSCCLLALHGWRESVGVAQELRWARNYDKPLVVAQITADGYALLFGAEAWEWVDRHKKMTPPK